MMKYNRMTSDWKQRLHPELIYDTDKNVSTFGTSRDNGRNRVPRLGPPTIRIALLSPIYRREPEEEEKKKKKERLSLVCCGKKGG
jgi:hypothetical protein